MVEMHYLMYFDL